MDENSEADDDMELAQPHKQQRQPRVEDRDAQQQEDQDDDNDQVGREGGSRENHVHDGSIVVEKEVETRVETKVTTAEEKPSSSSLSQRLCALYQQQEFLLWILAAIGLAKLYPILGARYFYPSITSDWIAVMLIFLLSGISLRTSELVGSVAGHWRFHLVVQLFSLGVVPAEVYSLTRALFAIGILARPLADGMVICACLPMTINMVMVLTKAAGGDDASALVGAVLGNGMGVILSPLLILGYLGVRGNVKVGEVFVKLALRVLLPVVVGQVLQKTTRIYEAWYQPHKKWVAKLQQLLLAFIVYSVFCETFLDDRRQVRVSDVFLMVLFQFLLLTSLMAIVWYGLLRRVAPPQRVMGLFGCTHKTVAIGIPLINALYENSSSGTDTKNGDDNDNAALVALYALPLLVWHPLQLVLGTLLAPYLAAYVTAHMAPPAHINEEEDNVGSNKLQENAISNVEDCSGEEGGTQQPPPL